MLRGYPFFRSNLDLLVVCLDQIPTSTESQVQEIIGQRAVSASPSLSTDSHADSTYTRLYRRYAI